MKDAVGHRGGGRGSRRKRGRKGGEGKKREREREDRRIVGEKRQEAH